MKYGNELFGPGETLNRPARFGFRLLLELVLGLVSLPMLLASNLGSAASCEAGTPRPNTPVRQARVEYLDHGNGTVTHKRTGLLWKRCAEGQTWSGSSCTGTASFGSWSDALVTAKDSDFAGHTGWRLPNRRELESILETCGHTPAINTNAFPNSLSEYFWTSTSYALDVDYVWIVNFDNGYAFRGSREGYHATRLVRSGLSLSDFDRLGALPLPGPPTSVSATPLLASVQIGFTPPAAAVGITSYVASCVANGSTPGLVTGVMSPLSVLDLVPRVSYACTVAATNSRGTGPASTAVVVVPLGQVKALSPLLLLLLD